MSLALVVAGLVGFFTDPLHLPEHVLGVLDQRASVISMFVGIAGLLMAGAGLWAQLRAPATSPEPVVPGGLASPMISGSMSGGQVIGQVTDSVRVSGPGSMHVDQRSVAGQIDAPVMTGDGVMITGGIVVGTVGGVQLPPRPPVPARPVRLAPRPPQLAGRDQTLAVVHQRLTSDQAHPSLLVIHGLGGVGKTSLVVEYAHRYQHAYRLVWQLPAEDATVLSAAFAELAALLGMRQPGELVDPVHQVHAALAASPDPWLLIFDNALDAEALRAFLPPVGDGHVLVTTRSGHWPTRHSMELHVLDNGPAAVFLTERTGDNEPDTAAAVAVELGGLPLALEQAGAYIDATGTTLAGYLHLLRRRRAEMLAQGQPWGYDQHVASTWHLAFDHLTHTSPHAIALIRLLACYAPEAIPYRLLLTPLDHDDTADSLHDGDGLAELRALPHGELDINTAISELRRHGLINRPVGGTVSVHRLVQAVTLDQLPPPARTAWQHAAATLLQTALPVTPRQPDTWPRYTQLLPHARAALPLTSPALHQVAIFLGCSGDYRTSTTLIQQMQQEFTAKLGAEHPDTLKIRHNLAAFTGEAGDAAAARDRFAALLPDIERVLGADHPGTLTTRGNLARWTGDAGDAAAARDQFAALLPVHERVLGADHPDTLTTRHYLASWTGEAGEPAAARDQYAALLPDVEQVLGPEHPDTLNTRHNLAALTGKAGDAAAACDQLALLLPVRERVLGAEHPDTLTTRHNLAYSTGEAGDAAAARDQLALLLPVRERVLGADHPDTHNTRDNLARWTGEAGDAAAACDQLAALLSIRERTLGADHPYTLATRRNLTHWENKARQHGQHAI
ncbi:FxSxx-COOH system tetratricopeptide repeat protein [Sphaerisporangium rhizosphaerae]|uniref:FxSxx-COOH system tetratricopeptide repeat protein n=1 Tax=Sphaerisporangium rhizosphaerae TaxID=2269375 RepID=A0ABW2P2X5_9ACTN